MKMVCFVLHLILIGFIKYLQYFAATIIFSGNVFAPHLQIKMYKHRQLVNQTLPGSFHPLRHSSRTATKQRHEKHTCLVRQSCYRLQASHMQLKCPGKSSRLHPNMPFALGSISRVDTALALPRPHPVVLLRLHGRFACRRR